MVGDGYCERSLAGRTALVTGAGAGLGRAYALALARRGAAVVVNDIDAAGAAETARLVESAGGRAETAVFDVRDGAAAEAAVAAAGPVGILINNAGIDEGKKTEEIDEASFDRMLDIHLLGCFLCGKAAIPGMKALGGGAIVNVSSINGMIADDTDPHYNAAKAGIIGLTKAWAKELAPWGIRVNALAPGHVRTPATTLRGAERMRMVSETRIPFGRYAEPEEIAEAAVFLASDESAFVTGQVLSPNGGEAIVGI
ncbi:MAG: SDR family oxidoreductase [Rhodospirillaceae bacterium]|nr:SDR family oxidoreductase [Rhodospirillaceae bacterium]MBT6116484.1 SDR family oxidoreductase [Rhodospirillaceae bacterium]